MNPQQQVRSSNAAMPTFLLSNPNLLIYVLLDDAGIHVISEKLIDLRGLRVDGIVERVPGPLEALVEVQAIHVGHETNLDNLQ